MKPFLLTAVMAITVWLHGWSLFKRKDYRDLALFLAFILLSYTIALIALLGIKLPNPTKAIEFAVKLFFQTKFSYR